MNQVKAEILTDAGEYTVDVNLPEGREYSSLLEYWKDVQDTIAAGMPFAYGKGLLAIGSGAVIKHIRLFEVRDDVVPIPSDDVKVEQNPAESGGFFNMKAPMVYLGVWVEMELLAFNDVEHNKGYYLPMVADGRPAQDVISKERLAHVIEDWLLGEGHDPEEYVILVPHAQLENYEEAALYITDYITETAEVNLVRQPGTAKAWQGYRHEGGA